MWTKFAGMNNEPLREETSEIRKGVNKVRITFNIFQMILVVPDPHSQMFLPHKYWCVILGQIPP